MNNAKRMLSFFMMIILVVTIQGTTVFANDSVDAVLVPTTDKMIQDLDMASQKLADGTISRCEYDSILLDIYQIKNTRSNLKAAVQSNDYYPEVQTGYIDHEGVVYLYEEGLKNAATASAAVSLLLSALPGAGWGLGAISVICAYAGKSALESAVNRAYFSGKGIIVYYQIHKSITRLNRVRYVVG